MDIVGDVANLDRLGHCPIIHPEWVHSSTSPCWREHPCRGPDTDLDVSRMRRSQRPVCLIGDLRSVSGPLCRPPVYNVACRGHRMPAVHNPTPCCSAAPHLLCAAARPAVAAPPPQRPARQPVLGLAARAPAPGAPDPLRRPAERSVSRCFGPESSPTDRGVISSQAPAPQPRRSSSFAPAPWRSGSSPDCCG